MPFEVLVEYQLEPGREDEADQVRRDFLAATEEWGDPGFGYRVLRKGGDGHFVHIAWLADEATQKRLFEQEFFGTFNEGMQRVTGGDITATRLEELGAAGTTS